MSDRKKIITAIAASLLLHLLLFIFLAIWTQLHPEPAPEAQLPQRRQVEVTIMRNPPKQQPAKTVAAATPTPPPEIKERHKEQPRTIDTEGLQTTEKAPQKADFEADKNSIAASELPASGNEALPSQQGREDRKSVDFKTQNYSLGKGNRPPAEAEKPASQPQPSPPQAVTKIKPQPTPAQPAPETPTSAQQMAKLSDNLFAMQKPTPAGKPKPVLQPTPPPVMKTPPRPKAEPGYQAQKQQTKIAGSISNRGRAGVNALGTPLGRYQKLVGDSVGSRWYYYVGQRMDLITVGEARIRFCVNTSGHVEDVQIMSNTSNQIFGEYCIQSIIKAELPPIPPDLAALLEDGKLEIEFSFTIYPN